MDISQAISILHGLNTLFHKGTICNNYGITTDHYKALKTNFLGKQQEVKM
jgi:hypothetical protein